VTAEDFTLDELVTALSLRVIHMIMAADEIVRPEEVAFLHDMFPAEVLEGTGFVDLDDGMFTQRFAEAIEAAPGAVQCELGKHERLGLLDLFFRACEADGDVDPREVGVVLQGARMLGLAHADVVAHLNVLIGEGGVSGTRGLGARRDSIAVDMSDASTAILAVTQNDVHDALGGTTDPAAEALRQRIEAVVENEKGHLVLVTSAADLRGGLLHGWHALISALLEERRLLRVAGRLDFEVEGRRREREELCDVPEIRAWMGDLLHIYPWLPAWLDPDSGSAAQLIAPRVPGKIRDPDHVLEFLATAVESANYAVALTGRLGSNRADHVLAYLAQFGMEDIPPGYFHGVAGLEQDLDALGRRAPTPTRPELH